MKEILCEGLEIPDELYVRIFVANLCIKYKYKSPFERRKELVEDAKKLEEIDQRIQQINSELAYLSPDKMKRAKKLNNEKEILEGQLTDLQNLSLDDGRGWILVNFP